LSEPVALEHDCSKIFKEQPKTTFKDANL